MPGVALKTTFVIVRHSTDTLEFLPLDFWAWKNNTITAVGNTDMGSVAARRPVWVARRGSSVGPHMITCPPALRGEPGPSVVGCRPVVMREALKSWSGGLSAQLRPEWLAEGAGAPGSVHLLCSRGLGQTNVMGTAPGSGWCWSGWR